MVGRGVDHLHGVIWIVPGRPALPPDSSLTLCSVPRIPLSATGSCGVVEEQA